MKEWLMSLCPEIEEWQAEIIDEQVQCIVKSEREECAKVCEDFDVCDPKYIAAAIRARNDHD